jgi:solute carrier family 66, member 2
MGFLHGISSFITGFVAPIFLIISPITSYADQTYAIHRNKSSAGFSLDIPLIMLVASILRYFPNQQAIVSIALGFSAIWMTIVRPRLLKLCYRVFYYPGARFDTSLLVQAFIMITIQLVLLKVALDHRPSPSSKGGEAAIPFAASREGSVGAQRPYNFWQWRSPKP